MERINESSQFEGEEERTRRIVVNLYEGDRHSLQHLREDCSWADIASACLSKHRIERYVFDFVFDRVFVSSVVSNVEVRTILSKERAVAAEDSRWIRNFSAETCPGLEGKRYDAWIGIGFDLSLQFSQPRGTQALVPIHDHRSHLRVKPYAHVFLDDEQIVHIEERPRFLSLANKPNGYHKLRSAWATFAIQYFASAERSNEQRPQSTRIPK